MDMDLVKAFVAGQIRHVFTGAAGYLVAKGVLIEPQGGAFIDVMSAIALYGIGALWSLWQKWRNPPPIPAAALRVLPLLVVLPLLGGCVTMSAGELSAFLDRVNVRIVTVDELAHKFCPSLAVVNGSAKAVACAAKASGTTQGTLNKVIAYGSAFCANPTSAGVASLTANVGVGIRAVLAADQAGCGAP